MKNCTFEKMSDGDILCVEHYRPSSHVSPDGGNTVCNDYAKEYGCSCCPENSAKADIPRIPLVVVDHLGNRLLAGEIRGELVIGEGEISANFKLEKGSHLWGYIQGHESDKSRLTIKPIEDGE